MLFKNIDILDEQLNHRKNCCVGIRDTKIVYIGSEIPEEDFGEVYDGTGRLLMTGFINTHSHSAMTLMRGYAENMMLSDWLNLQIFPFEAKLTAEDIYNGTMLAAAEMLRFGIVSTTDMYFNIEATSKAVLETGIKMNFAPSITSFDGKGLSAHPVYTELSQALPTLQNAGNGRFKLDACIHAEYTSHEGIVRDVAAFAKENDLNCHIHLSETKAEQEACKERHSGKTPARYFYDTGLFDNSTTAAHCVWLEGDDFDLLKEKGVTVACNPVSNLKLASGFCPAPQLLSKGINVALGTDGVASNNNLNMLEEVKFFSTLYKASSADPTAITPKQALYAATRAGAIAQGRHDCGALKVGNCADLIVIDLRDRPYMRPCHDMLNNLVFSGMGTDVCLTMVNGQVLYRDGLFTTIDLDKVTYNVEQSIQRILSQL